jgi:hypothetical protein
MNTNEHASDKAEGIVEAVVGAAYEVGNVLGAGFMEKFMSGHWRGNWGCAA